MNSAALGNALLEQLSTAVLLLDQHLCVLYANPAAEQLFATSRAHLLERSIALFFWEDDECLDALHNALLDQRPYTRREARLHFPSTAQVMTMDYTATPFSAPESQGRQLLVELLPQDRVLRLSREDSLFTAHQVTRALVRGVAHEVKNPLGGIRGAAQLLARQLSAAELREYTDVIISETDRLSHVVDRMLGPRQRLHLVRINIHQVLERVRLILQAEVGEAITLTCDYDPSLPELHADLDRLIQVVLNIVRNAAQALLENPSERPAEIILRSRVLRQLTIGTHRHRLVCVVDVEDNGPGIDGQLLETLFYPMVTGRAQGSGLGLPIAQGIIQEHGGLIECESKQGHTVFRILIPVDPYLESYPGAFDHG
ncbi:MAG: ATP-binding protein [Pseudomonas sp.]|jgi:two-component system nitrogen regulation sensor histidine kinase GlnL|nr:ATP-binding protein [Pseudomonas sp.]MDD2224181.1 nitrogen regulation protein NR(II) [Pseudomonas sp.]MDY0414966.1 nitrogen regulation protein NR(II) [Pseudomonas sp.]NLO54237.1 PAS domain-containing protein [Gammaproteobacteria bacterium]